ncbi:MAG: hypothetical protein HY077_01730 [Elusimicrobia bacterium]|nr:hypothetical protein [Elusimicrobiota bacterium]
MTRRASIDRDAAACGALAVLILAQLVPPWLKGLAPFWGDLTYIHHPWRAFDSQLLQAGRLPLWDPYLYFGMPAAAAMQDSLYYPVSAPFFLFSFSGALLIFHAVQYCLSAALAYLWLRSLGLRRTAALAGSGLVCLGGVWLRERPFLNHLAVLSMLPGLLLLARRPRALALALCAAFLGGYPPFFVGAAAAAFALSLILCGPGARRTLPKVWASAGLWAAGLCGILLLPAVELVGLSRRAAGVGLEEALQFGFAPSDLAQWISPALAGSFDPAVQWWKSCFVGVVGIALAARGCLCLPRRRAAFLVLWLASVLLLLLGGTNSVSAALWVHLPLLKFVRYPGFLSYLAVPVLAVLAAAGVQRLSPGVRLAAVFLLMAELVLYGAGAFPLARADIFLSAGPLVRRLQSELGDHRYLLSPRALEAVQGAGYEDWKHRLYGLTNAPFRLRAAGNFGEPLVPQANFEVMDRLYSAKSAEDAASWFSATDISVLLTPRPIEGSKMFVHEGRDLWEVHRWKRDSAGAYALTEAEGAAIPAGLPVQEDALRVRQPLLVERPREDRFSIAGESVEPGWVFVSEPRFPGWRVTLETPRGEGIVQSLPALSAFQRVHVPAGSWRLDFRYAPGSWLWGLALSVLAGLAMAWRGWRAALSAPR